MPPKRLAAVAATLVAVAVPAGAQASTVSLEGGALVVRASPGEANGFHIGHGWDPARLRIGDYARPTAFPSTCVADDEEGLGALSCEVPPNGVRVEAGDGNDIVDAGDKGAAVPVTVDAGAGDDVVRAHDQWGVRMLGGAGKDALTGADGDDVLDGGAGDDDVNGHAGSDGVYGGDGNDTLAGDGFDVMGADVIDGGAGYDRIEYDWLAEVGSYQPPITVSLDGTAGDGRPGEGDNVTGVEKIGLNAPATLIGGDAAEDFSMFNTDGGGRLVGNGGDDKLTGFDLDDVIDGGAGNDVIAGGYGNDTITGGPGRDTINADNSGAVCGYTQCRSPYGNDTLDARDGEADTVECGIGEDVAYVDAIDRVSDCETVTDGPAPGGTAPDGGPTAPHARKLAVKRVRASLRHGLALTVAAPSAGRLTARAGRARRTVTVARARTVTARLRLAPRVRRGASLKVTVTHVAPGGARSVAAVRVRVTR